MSIYMQLVCFDIDMVDIVLLCKKLLYRKKKKTALPSIYSLFL